MKPVLFLNIALFYLLSSCSVEKRHYMQGYYFGKHTAAKSIAKKENQSEEITFHKEVPAKPEKKRSENDLALVISKKTSQIQEIQLTKLKQYTNKYQPLAACDSILLKNGTLVLAKVVEINSTEIKTEGCDGGPPIKRTINISSIKNIKYANGTKEEFAETPSERKQEPQKKPTVAVVTKVSALAVASFIMAILFYPLGIISIIGAVASLFTATTSGFEVLLIFTILDWILGFVFGIVGIAETTRRQDKKSGLGFAIAGLLILVIPILLIIILAAGF